MAVLAASPAVIERLIPLLRATMDGQGLALTAVNAPQIDLEDAVRAVPEWSTSGPLAYLWLDLLSKQPTMVLVEPRSSLVHVRPLAVHPDPDMVETELIRFVVRSSLEAILKGQAQGVTREKFAPEKLETCVAATPARISTIDRTPARSRSKWMVGVGYSGAILTGDSIVHGPELGVELRRPNFHLSATLLQSLPLTVTQSGLGTRLASSGIRIVAAVPVAIGPRTSASIGLGAGVDATHVGALRIGSHVCLLGDRSAGSRRGGDRTRMGQRICFHARRGRVGFLRHPLPRDPPERYQRAMVSLALASIPRPARVSRVLVPRSQASRDEFGRARKGGCERGSYIFGD